MQNPMNPANVSKFLPVIDFALLILLSIFGTAGQSWIKNHQNDQAALGQKETSAVAIRPRLAELAEEAARKEAEIQAKKKQASALQEEILSFRTRLDEVQAKLEEQARRAERDREMKEEIERLKEYYSRLERERESLSEKCNRLKKLEEEMKQTTDQIRKAQAASAALACEIKAIIKEAQDRPVIRVEGTPLMDTQVQKAPVYVALVQGAALPVREPYFHMDTIVTDCGEGRFETVIKAAPVQGGFPISAGFQDAPELRHFFSSLDPEKDYVALLVDSASFAAFRVLRQELRQMGMPFGWEPCSVSILQFSRAGQIVGEEK